VADHKPIVFRFGEFEVREREYLLIKAGESAPVEPKAFRVLLFLLQNPGRLVKKDEILNAVWDDCSVSDNSLTRSVATLRRLLGDDPREPQYIATVQTVGYRFVCPVEVSEGGLNQPAAAPSLVTDDQAPRAPSRRRAKWLLAAVIAACVIFAGAWFGYRLVKNHDVVARLRNSSVKHSAAAPVRVVQLTNLNGNVSWPAFSPDGGQIAFVWDAREHPSRGDLYVQFVRGESPPLRLTHTRSQYLTPPTWLPNGREVAYGRCDDNGGAIYVMSALGGPEHRITDVPCPYGYFPPFSWTSDEGSVVLADRCVSGGPIGIVVFSTEIGAKRCLVALAKDEELGDSGPVLSPDGQTVAFVKVRTGGSLSSSPGDLYSVRLTGGVPTRLTTDNSSIGAFMWTADGKFICFNSARGGTERTWRVPVGGGAIEPETKYPGVGSLSRDGSRLVYPGPSAFMGSSVWRAELSSEGGAVIGKRQLLPDSALDYGPQPSPDGRQIVFESMRSGHDEIWKNNADGSDPRKLTSLRGAAGTPRWSTDGKWIVFDYLPENQIHRQIFVVDEEGRNLHMVVSGNYLNGVASWSRDGKGIYFTSDRTGSFQIWRHELATGRETQITYDGGFACFESFDGNTLYFSKLSGGGIWAMPASGGVVEHVTAALHFGYWGEFAVTENGLYLVNSDADPGPALMYYSFRTRQLKPILNLNGPAKAVPWSANLGVSRDGRTVLVVLGTFRSSLVMAENLQ
jgi:Tol biopolymer transport system component/DNA-binding winged helix-turn-helix (wHTH) protein